MLKTLHVIHKEHGYGLVLIPAKLHMQGKDLLLDEFRLQEGME